MRYDRELLKSEWSAWRARLADDRTQPFNFKADDLNRYGPDRQRQEQEIIFDAALWLLRQDTIDRDRRDIDYPRSELNERSDLVNIDWNKLARLLKQLAADGLIDTPDWFVEADRDVMRRYWGQQPRFNEPLLEYLLRPSVYLKSFRDWNTEELVSLTQYEEPLAMRIARSTAHYITFVIASDPVRSLANGVVRGLVRHPVVRSSWMQIQDEQRETFRKLIYFQAQFSNLAAEDGSILIGSGGHDWTYDLTDVCMRQLDGIEAKWAEWHSEADMAAQDLMSFLDSLAWMLYGFNEFIRRDLLSIGEVDLDLGSWNYDRPPF